MLTTMELEEHYSIDYSVSLARIGHVLNTQVRADRLGVHRLRYGLQYPALGQSPAALSYISYLWKRRPKLSY
jgi:hypothetical protein